MKTLRKAKHYTYYKPETHIFYGLSYNTNTWNIHQYNRCYTQQNTTYCNHCKDRPNSLLIATFTNSPQALKHIEILGAKVW